MIRSLVYDRLRILTPPQTRTWIKNHSWFVPVSKIVFGNAVYSRSYYDDVERLENVSVVHLADWIRRNLAPSSIIDVGCGPGHLMAELNKWNVKVFGVDISPAALRRVNVKGLKAKLFDLTQPGTTLFGGPYDLAITCEVAEHLDESFARTFVQKLTDAAPIVFMTAAEPDLSQGVGLYHVNEQPNAYWTRLMCERDFELDETATASARSFLATKPVVRYLQRPMVFRHRAATKPAAH